MRTAADYLRKHPSARPSTIAFIDRRNAVVEQLKRELEADEAAKRPTNKSIIGRFMPWFGRRA
ncbi:hypothetical protein [Rhizobium leguminosarum]|uniref:hypothetical protein n=1 Tax=Rhizobium leguminosarum TaxID=384 RepID=UPI001030FB9C|nr:hypothetical protein [Rhizobium leguminosarum]TAV89273.1 hypothetical protein ELI22_08630 [Rhizobium leguminosarum]TAV93852.1 hypothetical protein ELI21_08615 [Rhizobium leguminosarum]TAW34928.1 hypothetical protein ELI23_08655 [Rhizobium leguminosarum]